MCRDWLLSLRPADVSWFGSGPVSEIDDRVLDPERIAPDE
jgi:hypothetical protein